MSQAQLLLLRQSQRAILAPQPVVEPPKQVLLPIMADLGDVPDDLELPEPLITRQSSTSASPPDYKTIDPPPPSYRQIIHGRSRPTLIWTSPRAVVTPLDLEAQQSHDRYHPRTSCISWTGLVIMAVVAGVFVGGTYGIACLTKKHKSI
ncbi:hypothetical protein AMS68_004297 [Peltaster fructicola]|uniref:Uncharacterized protein n=1 Tax=Peltaster fructicola TaxID=286661 RepID=A0A6H0XWF9_9PEZI|nr:hypothetical protein AMS68_004297 [Peltaster fructicola]